MRSSYSKQLLFLFSLIPIFLWSQNRKVVIGYVGGYNGNVIDASQIQAKKLTHINYAFVNVKDNKAYLEHEATDTINFRKLNGLKKINPDLKILISVGGWIWSKNFSDATLDPAVNKQFAQSAIAITAKYGLDGVDIDWEYPEMKGDGNVFRPEDAQSYTLLFKNLREGLDSLGKVNKKKYLVTTAV